VPHFTVQMLEEKLDGTVEPKIISELTEAVVRVYGEWARPLVVAGLLGVPRNRWGHGGQVTAGAPAIVTLNMREAGLTRPDIDSPPARLIESITEAMSDALGPAIRDELTVLVVGTPEGRSGVGGAVV
jgi:phenylpyruvate tautomerase PptA (4-oxalocrotonate tautomerase family)